ncbi:hypothetical protein C8F04DRAFT_1269138 [Mycena alexandri]|uniref:peptide-methionine (S)-S-oxide reductase n=1 Tax=Mycena alexandri TaxID=1745969 RepID=A0AAD6WW40_9AGAR|nr:hypothetical protein C8F04DRAFT_1269138 [Mycena alexandri]
MAINAFLPNEVLINLFEQGKSSEPFEIGGSTLMLQISQTCAAWRTITHTYPILWEDIRLTACSSPRKARNLLARSEGGPIAVTIDGRPMPRDQLALWNVLNLIMAQDARLRSLHVVGTFAFLRVLARACLRHYFPQLLRLTVDGREDPDPGSIPPTGHSIIVRAVASISTLSTDVPNLTKLSLVNTSPPIIGNYPQLRTLRLDNSGYLKHFKQPELVVEPEILALETLIVHKSALPLFTHPALLPADSNIVIFVLADLLEHDLPAGALSRFLRLLRMPRLEHLEVKNIHGYLWDEFVQSLRHDGGPSPPKYPHLMVLHFRELRLTGIRDLHSLHAVQTVQEIGVFDVDWKPLWEVLERYGRACPNIRSLRRCFWGTEYMFLKQFSPEEGKGIVRSSVGFAVTAPGGSDFAEAVRIEFVPELISYAGLVEFFYRSHDPTTLDAQGADIGSEYRSAIFTHSEEQLEIAKRVTTKIQAKHFSPKRKTIVTQIDALGKWQAAQEDHQKYLFKHPQGYHCKTHVLHW